MSVQLAHTSNHMYECVCVSLLSALDVSVVTNSLESNRVHWLLSRTEFGALLSQSWLYGFIDGSRVFLISDNVYMAHARHQSPRAIAAFVR